MTFHSRWPGCPADFFAMSVPRRAESTRLSAKSAALACKKYFKFDTVVPIHYGTFPIIDQDPSKFLAAMKGQNVLVPEISKPFEV